jgi:serine/threonine protein kinase
MKNDGLVYIPLTLVNAGTFAMLLLFAIIGCISVWYLLTRNRCHCSLCKGQYNVVSSIGIAAGGFGKILCVTKTSDGAEKAARKYVLKMVPIEHVTEANSAQLEAKELRNLKHPLIVHYEDDFIHTQWTRVGESIFVCILMEHCEQDLRTAIVERETHFEQEEACRLIGQVCEALCFCHEKLIMHRDIKVGQGEI